MQHIPRYARLRTFTLDNLRSARLLCALGLMKDADDPLSSRTAEQYISGCKNLRIQFRQVAGGVEFVVNVDSKDVKLGMAIFSHYVAKADDGQRKTIRKALLPFARTIRNFGAGGYYRVRNNVELLDLIDFYSDKSVGVPAEPSFPFLMSMQALEVGNVTMITMADIECVISMMQSDEFACPTE